MHVCILNIRSWKCYSPQDIEELTQENAKLAAHIAQLKHETEIKVRACMGMDS